MDKRYSLKTVIVAFVLGAFIFGIVGAQAATIMAGSDVGYSNTTSGSSATTVQGALDDLYSKFTGGNAAASQILSGKTAYVGGKLVTGTMTNRGSSDGYTESVSHAWDGNTMYFRIPTGAYLKSTAAAGYPEIYTDLSDFANEKYNQGVSATKVGTAGAAQVLSGYTFTNSSSVGASGTMPERGSSTAVSGDKAWSYNNKMYFGIDYGFYPAASYGSMSNVSEKYITYASLARDIGLTAGKIMSGNTILGIAGTASGATTHTGTYTLTSSETGTKDLGTSHSYRYVNASNVYNKGVSDTKKGTAGAAQVLSGYTFTNSSSVGASGSMVNASTKTNITLTSSDGRKVLTQTRSSSGDARVWAVTNSDLINRLSILLPYEGYYPSGTIIAVPYPSVRDAIGLTAAKIVSGNSVLGLNGTGGTKSVSWSYVIERSGERLWGDFKVNGTTVLTFYNNGVGTPYDSIGAGSGNGLYGSGNIQV